MPSDGPQDVEIGHQKPAPAARARNGRNAKPRGRRRTTGLAAILQNALDEPAADEDGRGGRPSKREVVIRRLVEKSAGADLAATKLLFALLHEADIEERAGAPGDAEPFSQGALAELKERLARLAAAAAAVAHPPPAPAAAPDSNGAAIEAEDGETS